LLLRLVCETTCPAATAQQFRQASKTPVEAFSRPCRPSGVSEPQKTRCRPAMAVWLRLFEWKGCQGHARKPHAERRAKPEHRTGEDVGEAEPLTHLERPTLQSWV